MPKVLFVCLGNICRSPTAEGVFIHLLQQQGRMEQFVVDSAGTSAYHVGESADKRSIAVANKRGIHLPSIARQFVVQDFDTFDIIVAMDHSNKQNILSLARNSVDISKVHLFRDFDPTSPKGTSVPDPYYENNFDEVLDICIRGCEGMISHFAS